jgi:clan AA aspartic protease (TIGR02281 family)
MSARSKLNKFFGKNLVVLLFLLVAFCAAQVSIAGVYTYRDDKGKIHFVDAISKIPKQYRKNEKGVRKIPDARKVAPQSSSASGQHMQLPGAVASNGEIEVPLIPTSGGNFLVDIVINGSIDARLILDTGASFITLTEDIGSQLGITPFSDTAEMPFGTAGGTDWGKLVALDTVRIGGAEARLVEASINSHIKDIDGLLGMSFLGDFKFEIDRNKNLLTLRSLQDPNELTWDGKPGSWWENRFIYYKKSKMNFADQAKAYKRKGHAKARSLEKAADFYEDLKKKLLSRASTSGLPDRFRPSS